MKMLYICPICQSNASYIFTSKHNKYIYNCLNSLCGHFFTPPQNSSQGICQRTEDILHESNEQLGIYHYRNSRLVSLFTSFTKKVNKPYRFLDFGAGNAHISRSVKAILGNDAKIYCFEPNSNCSILYKKFNLSHVISIHELPLNIDLIYMIEVIEHIENPIEVLKILKDTLSENGKIFISTPIGSKDESLTNAYDTPSHLHFFTQKSINLTLQKAGLHKVSFKYFPHMYPTIKSNIFWKFNLLLTVIKNFLIRFGFYKIKHLVFVTYENKN